MMMAMSTVNLASIDLNLLVVLDTVLETSSATTAAKRLHVTQPAVSNALRRLREVFGDALLVRTARGLAPTPRAAALAPELKRWLESARSMLGAARFDPAETTRRFTIAGTDALGATLLPALFAAFRARFPRAFLRFVTLERLVAQDGLGSGDVDLHVGIPPSIPAFCRSEPVYEDRFLVAASKKLKLKRMDLKTYVALPHVENALFGEADDAIDRMLADRGLSRVVRAAVPHLSLLTELVAETDAIATVSDELIRASRQAHRLDAFRPPLPMPPLRLVQVWHQRSDDDPGLAAFRALVREVARRPRRGGRASLRR
jgi:DNA-binding transcriptional LysR family regulator